MKYILVREYQGLENKKKKFSRILFEANDLAYLELMKERMEELYPTGIFTIMEAQE